MHAVWPPEWMGEDAQAQIKKLPGPKPIPLLEAGRLNKVHVIVDALLGTGSSGVLARARGGRDPGDGGRGPR